LPDIGEGLTEAEIVEWFVAVGDDIIVDQAIVEIETAKTAVEITATHPGTMLSLGGAPGDSIAVGDILFVIGDGRTRNTEQDSHQPSASLPRRAGEDVPRDEGQRGHPKPPFSAERVRAMPIVRKLAKERGIDLSTVDGTGQGGSITRADLENAQTDGSTVQLVAMGRKRRAIARHMSESWATIPHVTVQADIRAEQILAARELADPTPSVEAIVARAVVPLLARYREFNATVLDDSIEYHDRIHIGIAVDTTDGLMVVVVRDADTLSLHDLAGEIQRLARTAHDGTLLPHEATGQTFTISNIGALGGGHGTPIIPMGTSAILSIGLAHSAPVVEEGTLTVGVIAPIDLSYDHRLIDGGLGQRFLSDLVSTLESAGTSADEGTP
jgi:pyruvate dehydrogenase E2 component (dihydrolipoamide acetyltransferase)